MQTHREGCSYHRRIASPNQQRLCSCFPTHLEDGNQQLEMKKRDGKRSVNATKLIILYSFNFTSSLIQMSPARFQHKGNVKQWISAKDVLCAGNRHCSLQRSGLCCQLMKLLIFQKTELNLAGQILRGTECLRSHHAQPRQHQHPGAVQGIEGPRPRGRVPGAFQATVITPAIGREVLLLLPDIAAT